MENDKYEYELYKLKTKGNADRWLKSNGITPEKLLTIDIELLQAQRIAHTVLKHHATLLGQNEAASLNNFLHKMANGGTRKKLTKKDCYRVMNIGTAVNRKLFKQYRHTKTPKAH